MHVARVLRVLAKPDSSCSILWGGSCPRVHLCTHVGRLPHSCWLLTLLTTSLQGDVTAAFPVC